VIARRLSLASAAILAIIITMTAPLAARDLSYVVKVNGEPITSYDVAQRQKFMALTSGALGKRMRAALDSQDTKRKFQQFMQQKQPSSRAEAQQLQKEFVNQIQQQVMRDINNQSRDAAIDELIEEQLMLAEAKRHKVTVSDAQVNERLTQMAKSGNKDRSLDEFLSAFRKQGVNPETMRQRIRAQIAWRDVIRKLYGFRIASLVGTSGDASEQQAANARDAVFDVRRIRLASASGSGQAALARAYVQGQSIRRQFSSCGGLETLVGRANGATMERHSGKKAAFFPRDARPLLMQASEDQMLPPILSSDGVDLYAVCGKKTPQAEAAEQDTATSRSDRRQEEFQIYARRHLKDLRQDALIERR